jgi:thiol:disulfide interchange protein
MDTVTYPDASVMRELANWVFVSVDIAERREVAELMEVAGIPVAVAVSGDGEELGRIENFVEPGGFRKQLEGLRQYAGR